MRRLLALLLAICLLFATAACGDDSSKTKADDVDMGEKIKGLSVSGAFGAEPKVTVKPAVKADKPTTQVISKGDGNPVVANKKAMFNIYLAKGATARSSTAAPTRAPPRRSNMTEKEFFKVIIDGLVGKPQGSRVAIAATVKDVWGSAGAPQLKLKTDRHRAVRASTCSRSSRRT